MPAAAFWQLIDQAVAAAPADNEGKEHFLMNALAAKPLEEIVAFELALRQHIIAADDYGLMAAQKIIDGYVTDDSWLYFRCWLIGQGQAVFAAALQNPDTLTAVVPGPYECDFESLLYVATAAYQRQTGKEEDDTFPRSVALSQGLDYDFMAAETQGEDWVEEDLPRMLPKLWKKFR
ncbi:DUF4240 domain-containing protein [Hymenobacter oligotrophus]|nr:DUF4240 domain-containing protein [Hymenobacter oligotrophus]